MPSNRYHIGAANISIGRTTALYIVRHLAKIAPHIKPVRHLNALAWVAVFVLVYVIWGPHRSLEFIWNPKTLIFA